MKIAVFSDTHGSSGPMLRALREERPDMIIHLGDGARDVEAVRREFPDIPLRQVCGNCDVSRDLPLDDILELGEVRTLITHGHGHSVDWGRLDSLAYAAQERKCTLAMFGHTHSPENTAVGGVRLINPGTAGRGHRLTYALVEVYENGGVTAEIREIPKGI